MNHKPYVKHVGNPAEGSFPLTPKADWPDFPPSEKPSTQSAFRTVLWFHGHLSNGVRIIVEGRDQKAVDAYAKMINQNT